MKNPNKDYIVDVNVKTSTVSASSNLKFAITDINTSNIFFRLVFNESSNSLVNSYAPQESAENYKLTLRIVKPSNQPIDIDATLLDQNSNFFIVDLPDNYKDVIGTYECELFIDTNINGRLERSTTNSFTYEVVKSIYNGLDRFLTDDNDYPIVDTLLNDYALKTDIPTLDGYATESYVTNAINNAKLGGVDSSGIDLSIYAPISSPNFTNSISLGRKTSTTIGRNSIALGDKNTASGICSIALGSSNQADNYYSYAEGYYNTANGKTSHAEGGYTTSTGEYSHSQNHHTQAIGNYSHAEGYYTVASSKCQHVQGMSNVEDADGRYAHIVGNGTGIRSRSNAHTLDWNGNAWFAGNVYVGGTKQDEGNKLLSTADIHFDESGNLVVKIGDISKTFAPVQ